MNNLSSSKIIKVLREKLYNIKKLFSWHSVLKHRNMLFRPMLSVGRIAVGFKYSRSTISSIFLLTKDLTCLFRKNGFAYSARYMKYCGLYVMKSVGRESSHNLHSSLFDARVSLTRGGLPRIIPVHLRALIRLRDPRAIRLVLTIFNLYRVLPFPGKVKLSTITDPWKGYIPSDLILFIPIFIKMIGTDLPKYQFSWRPFTIFSSGVGIKSVISDAITWKKTLKGFKNFKPLWRRVKKIEKRWQAGNSTTGFLTALFFLRNNYKMWDSVEWFFNSRSSRLQDNQRHLKSLEGIYKLFRDKLYFDRVWDWGDIPGGKLAYKQEPGKVRVFAMVDCITQWLLRPLHDWIFKILRHIGDEFGTDATFDQDKGVLRLQKLLQSKRKVYSFDLSAATDRLPIDLQKELLNSVFPKLGDNWANLLVGRSYTVPKSVELVQYATGQPMGALSSWGMLALTHHLIVQFAAFKAYRKFKWFKHYLVLGDDIVILDHLVAMNYLDLMEALGVEVNQHKSLQSVNGHAEFAKRFVNGYEDLSGISLKQLMSIEKGWSNLLSIVKKYSFRTCDLLLFLGFGSKSSGNFKWKFSEDWSQKRWLYECIHCLNDPVSSLHPLVSDVIYLLRGWVADRRTLLENAMSFWGSEPEYSVIDWGRLNNLQLTSDCEFQGSRLMAQKFMDWILLPISQDWEDLGSPKVVSVATKAYQYAIDLLQLLCWHVFWGSDLWENLCFQRHTGFIRKGADWWDLSDSFDRFLSIVYSRRVISKIRNFGPITSILKILKDDPKTLFFRDYDASPDYNLEFLFASKPSDEWDIKLFKDMKQVSSITNLKHEAYRNFNDRYRYRRKLISW